MDLYKKSQQLQLFYQTHRSQTWPNQRSPSFLVTNPSTPNLNKRPTQLENSTPRTNHPTSQTGQTVSQMSSPPSSRPARWPTVRYPTVICRLARRLARQLARQFTNRLVWRPTRQLIYPNQSNPPSSPYPQVKRYTTRTHSKSKVTRQTPVTNLPDHHDLLHIIIIIILNSKNIFHQELNHWSFWGAWCPPWSRSC